MGKTVVKRQTADSSVDTSRCNSFHFHLGDNVMPGTLGTQGTKEGCSFCPDNNI